MDTENILLITSVNLLWHLPMLITWSVIFVIALVRRKDAPLAYTCAMGAMILLFLASLINISNSTYAAYAVTTGRETINLMVTISTITGIVSVAFRVLAAIGIAIAIFAERKPAE